jgi:hypothetical protein
MFETGTCRAMRYVRVRSLFLAHPRVYPLPCSYITVIYHDVERMKEKGAQDLIKRREALERKKRAHGVTEEEAPPAASSAGASGPR